MVIARYYAYQLATPVLVSQQAVFGLFVLTSTHPPLPFPQCGGDYRGQAVCPGDGGPVLLGAPGGGYLL